MSNSKYSRAIAINYDQSRDEAPVIEANATFASADLVVKIAHRFGVPVVEKPSLASALSETKADQQIPSSLYRAVAIVLAGIESITNRLRKK
ncbi:MAG TPA: EscU/YscU/HrcU family type III secretion system export apparatus switch protein [Oligoflexia bacterium]|nr:EscU/YscU/HrcU family type III secretion system export apparatus switch protein [Oligoflexia bacterium]HMP27653.1 EscU/YscU/HrcU family type III secretion system export apparatus switch protein [Oligoflexia bacterium]